MSKFEELCSAYSGVKREYDTYRHECMAIVGTLLTGLREYLEAPEGFVSLYAKGGGMAGRKVDGPSAAMHMADDTFWHFGIAIDLYEETNQMPMHCVGFDMRLKKVGHKFILHVEGGPPFELSKDNPDRMAALYDFIFQFIKGRYECSFAEFVLKGDASRRFGF
jgi:hypothetical protein